MATTFPSGHLLIASKPVENDSFWQVGLVMSLLDNDPTPFVTMQFHPERTREGWVWGNYFRTIEAAVTDYSERG